MNPMDEAKRAHFKPKTAQQEQIMKLQTENRALTQEINELRERMIDYREFVKAMNKLEAIEAIVAWFEDDDEDE